MDQELIVDVRKTIIEGRKRNGMSQTELANLAGVRVATISDFESGKAEMRTDTLSRILSLLSLHVAPRYDDVFANFTALQSDAKDTAKLLKEKGISADGVKKVSQDKMYEITQNEAILKLCNADEKTFEAIRNERRISDLGWFQYYRSVVAVELAVMR